MIEEVEKQVQSIVVIDISVTDEIVSVQSIQRTHVIDQIINPFKLGSGIHGDQTFLGINVLDLTVNGQGKVSGN